jgi:4-amino-4-deoxy-L-arabinose transferase-like glycosyltransferase
MHFLLAAKPWQKFLLLALAFFLVSRGLTLRAFPIFNDEAIYLQYSQRIHDDWAKNKYISMAKPEGEEWKPPLQYWLAAPFVRLGHDPLIAGRLVAFFVSLLGFCGFYFFAKELFGVAEGVICAWLYVLCPPVLFHNNQFITETFLFSTAPFVYWALLAAMRPGRQRWFWMILAALIATVLLLFKQSGFPMLAVSLFLPFTRLRRSPNETNGWSVSGWKEFAGNLVMVVVVIIAAQLSVRALLPTTFDATRESFKRVWVLSPQELLQLPIHVWRENLSVVSDYIGSYYSWFVPVFFGAFLLCAFRRKNLAELALPFMSLAGAAALIFLLRRFNEYLFNTAVIVPLLPLLARTFTLIWSLTATRPALMVRCGLLAFAALMLGYWSYQIALMGISPGKYFEQSTPWAVTNYLQGWPTGFGVKEVVAMLEQEKRPGIILTDAAWGNPCIALEIYRRDRFPNLRIVPVLPTFSDPAAAHQISEQARTMGPARFAIFSADPSRGRNRWQAEVERELCADRIEVKAYLSQMPIIVCHF